MDRTLRFHTNILIYCTLRLLQDLGWRAIFWFLVIAAGVSAVLMFL